MLSHDANYLDVEINLRENAMAAAARPDIWDATTYLRFASARLRPFLDLVTQVAARTPQPSPHTVVDLGCGPGNATELLADRWPDAHITGVDNSPSMITTASRLERPGRLRFTHGDIRTWTPATPADVITANAVLQWIPDHIDLLPHLGALLAPVGVLGFQVPGNFDQPTHRILAELRAEPRWHALTDGIDERPASHDPLNYHRALAAAGLTPDTWETTYTYVLDGPDGVLNFIKGTALRPILTHLTPDDARQFADAYAARVREAYPPTELNGHTVQIMTYRRIFAVATKP
jgi:trans-aconitate 2-methyltransferase